LCVAECPADAIFALDDVPEDQQAYIAINAEMAKLWPGINDAKDPLPDADQWVEVTGKFQYLER
jgi:ferredoxin